MGNDPDAFTCVLLIVISCGSEEGDRWEASMYRSDGQHSVFNYVPAGWVSVQVTSSISGHSRQD